VDHRLEHLRRRDHRLALLERDVDNPLLEQRHPVGPDLDAEIAAGNHQRVRLDHDRVERIDRLGLLDLRDHVRARARVLDQVAEIADVRRGANERQRDEVDAELQCELEIVEILARQRGNRHGHARHVDALVGADASAGKHGATCAAGLDALHAQPHEPVVDQHLVPRLQHLADDGGTDGKLAVPARVRADDGDLLAALDRHRLGQIADAELRALEVGDQRERTTEPLLRVADEPCSFGVLLARAVREVQARAVHAGLGERLQHLGRRGGGADRRDDLRAAERAYGGHLDHSVPTAFSAVTAAF
jgi:hypothetical protein